MLLNVSGCIKDSDICHSITSKTIGGLEDRNKLEAGEQQNRVIISWYMRARVITSVGSICHLIRRVINLEMFKINNTTVRISMGKYLYSLLVLYLSDGQVVVCDIPK